MLNETYLVICEQSQYVYFRNYMKRVVWILFILDVPKDQSAKCAPEHFAELDKEGVWGDSWPEIGGNCEFEWHWAWGEM